MPTQIRIKPGISKKHYAIFNNNIDAEKWAWLYNGCRLVSFGQYENAYELRENLINPPGYEDDYD